MIGIKSAVRIVLCIGVLCVVCFIYISQLNVYAFTPEICNFLLQQSPEEFCAEKGKGTLIQDGYLYSRVNKDGNLVLVLNDIQKDNWKTLMLQSKTLNLFKSFGDIEVSNDYTKCTIKCYKETVLDDTVAFMSNTIYCVFLQAIEGKNSEDIKVECDFVDAVTNEVKYHIVVPDEKLDFAVDTDVFSSLKETAIGDKGTVLLSPGDKGTVLLSPNSNSLIQL